MGLDSASGTGFCPSSGWSLIPSFCIWENNNKKAVPLFFGRKHLDGELLETIRWVAEICLRPWPRVEYTTWWRLLVLRATQSTQSPCVFEAWGGFGWDTKNPGRSDCEFHGLDLRLGSGWDGQGNPGRSKVAIEDRKSWIVGICIRTLRYIMQVELTMLRKTKEPHVCSTVHWESESTKQTCMYGIVDNSALSVLQSRSQCKSRVWRRAGQVLQKTPEVFHRFTTTLTKHIMNNIQASCSSLHQAAMLLLLARRRNGWEVQKESLDL